MKKRIATCSLAGCFGCHMSLLDMDEKLLDIIELVEFHKSPVTDIKEFEERCHIGLVEGGVANQDNLKVLRDFRQHCDVLVSVGACAVNGGLPALRNEFDLGDCLREAYLDGMGNDNPGKIIPGDPEIPAILDRVYPAHELVKIDYFLNGCPPDGPTIQAALTALVTGGSPELPPGLIRYD